MKSLFLFLSLALAQPAYSAKADCQFLLTKQESVIENLNNDFIDFYVWDGYVHILPDFKTWHWLNWVSAYISLHYQKELLIVNDGDPEHYAGAVVLTFSEYLRLRKAFPERKWFLHYLETVMLLDLPMN